MDQVQAMWPDHHSPTIPSVSCWLTAFLKWIVDAAAAGAVAVAGAAVVVYLSMTTMMMVDDDDVSRQPP